VRLKTVSRPRRRDRDHIPVINYRKHLLQLLYFFAGIVDSYTILAPNAVPSGFVDGKVASEKVLAALNIGDNYRIGHTKVFFKAGVLGQLEEMREEKLSAIFANFQARIRGYLIRKNYTKLCDQRSVGTLRGE